LHGPTFFFFAGIIIMAAEQSSTKKTPEAEEETQPVAQSGNTKPSWRRFLTGKWIATVILGSLALHGVGYLYYHTGVKIPAPAPVAEIPLGTFHFTGTKVESGRTAAANFSLYITLLDRMDRSAREALEARRFRVQQDVEQLLRQAHSGDFEDATLGELKRQLREQINESLGVRAVAEVIITDLKLKSAEPASQPPLSAAGSMASVEQP
jgi:flagellar basal body-associated protein FliL